MEFNRRDLLTALLRVMPAAGKENTKAVLACAKIHATEKWVSVECCNLEQSLLVTIEERIGTEATLLVNAHRLAEILKRSTCEVVTLEPEDKILSVVAGTARFDLPLHEPSEFPSFIGDNGPAVTAKLDSSELLRAINSTSYACAKDSARYSMMGVCVSGGNGVLDFVATDGRRLAKVAVPAEVGGVIEPTVVPAVAWRMLAGIEGTVSLAFGKRGLAVHCEDGLRLHTLLIDAKFPDYKAVLPKDHGSAWRGFAAADLLTAVRQAQVMVDRESMRLDVQLGATGPAGAQIVLGGKSATAGSSQITTFTRGEGKGNVSLNPQFLLEALASLPPEDEVRFEFRGNGPVTLAAGKVYTLLMPQT